MGSPQKLQGRRDKGATVATPDRLGVGSTSVSNAATREPGQRPRQVYGLLPAYGCEWWELPRLQLRDAPLHTRDRETPAALTTVTTPRCPKA